MKKFFLSTIFVLLSFLCFAQLAAKTKEEESEASIELGNIKADNGDWKGALDDYTNAIGYFPKNGLAYYHIGLAQQNLKEYPSAIANFSKAIYLNRSDAASYYGRGVCYYLIGNKQKCCFDLSKASELGYNDANQAIQNYCN
jgi:tetratricopeptide (TPR) repeat protein